MRYKSIVAALMICVSLVTPATAQDNKTPFDLSRINKDVIKKFKQAWQESGNGFLMLEGVVFIYQNSDGSYMASLQRHTNQEREFTFIWDSKAIAIAHTHPSDRGPMPSVQDERVADRLGVPIITITRWGMYMYDPVTKKTSKVMERLDWLNSAKWEQKADLASQIEDNRHEKE